MNSSYQIKLFYVHITAGLPPYKLILNPYAATFNFNHKSMHYIILQNSTLVNIQKRIISSSCNIQLHPVSYKTGLPA
jgi:hypothetical protein